MDEIQAAYLATARQWWTVTQRGPVPSDAELFAAYRRYHAEGFVLWHRLDECDAPELCRYHKTIRGER